MSINFIWWKQKIKNLRERCKLLFAKEMMIKEYNAVCAIKDIQR